MGFDTVRYLGIIRRVFMYRFHSKFMRYFDRPILGDNSASELLTETPVEEISLIDDTNCVASSYHDNVSADIRMVGTSFCWC